MSLFTVSFCQQENYARIKDTVVGDQSVPVVSREVGKQWCVS